MVCILRLETVTCATLSCVYNFTHTTISITTRLLRYVLEVRKELYCYMSCTVTLIKIKVARKVTDNMSPLIKIDSLKQSPLLRQLFPTPVGMLQSIAPLSD